MTKFYFIFFIILFHYYIVLLLESRKLYINNYSYLIETNYNQFQLKLKIF